ncbi:helix-turn-helix domain-containing protein [Comamonas sp. Tr-654]|uniref:helix-turn-helix domain-containing protein n=1 Tax=Comamonas sp. Tr-654 TaxID=2608341 RepID=UPI0014217594|nr:helix-turn-helix domain-containing protein [Comamonas sp. Tr-654]NIF85105.1 helix-turn-helix domain-containing protein [Comamonas sp. Tr-654]
MPRQNTSPADFPPAILAQIEELAQGIVAQRKQRGETQAQWAAKLGISQPTMARIERGDPSVAMATYVSCLWQLNPALDLTRLLSPAATRAKMPALAPVYRAEAPGLDRKRDAMPKKAKPVAEPALETVNHDEQQAQIERNFAAAKAALDFFKSPLF